MPPAKVRDAVATKTRKCSICQLPVIKAGDTYERLGPRRIACSSCAARGAEPPGALSDVPGVGKGATRPEAAADFVKLQPDDMNPVMLEKECSLIPDPVLAGAMTAISRGLGAFKVYFDRASDQWLAFPDQPVQMKAAETILAYRLGQPIKRIVKEEAQGPSEEDMLEKVMLNDRTMEIYSLYGVYAGVELEKLVATCGGDPKKIPAPRRRFQQR